MTDSPRTQRVRATLAAAVRIATGLADAEPRPGQLLLVDDMTKAADPLGGHMAGIAPTGVGKSLSAFSEAAVGVVDYGERWLISTESIGLQAQYVDKDGPVISAAAREVLGEPVTVAVLKGWSNHACVMKARDTAAQMGVPIKASESRVTQHADRVARANLTGKVTVDGQEMDSAKLRPLVAWALRQHASEELPGDRGHYEGAATDTEWSAVSVSPRECIGEQQCPLAAICKPVAARRRAAEADIVITNHSMLAVQAATGAPVVIGNSRLGQFDGIIVDEAHALPGIVRSQGQSQISGRRILSIAKKIRAVSDDRDMAVRKWSEDGRAVAELVDRELTKRLKGAKDVAKVGENDDPLEETGPVIEHWLKQGAGFAQTVAKVKGDMSLMIRGKRAQGDIDKAQHDLDSVREHRVGTARWLEPAPQPGPTSVGKEWASAQSAPVQVGRMIERNLWNETVKLEDEEDESRPLTVACISATLPEGFAREVGLNAVPKPYPSPFDTAYKNSLVFIPRAVSDEDVAALAGISRFSGRSSFDTKRHRTWATRHILNLVEANGGSALILSATSESGREYARALRSASRGRWAVHSQWDGENARIITKKWKGDQSSVMVGTRSMMTGVDAPGQTNTLVIVDRSPRSAPNPVDDARVELLSEVFDKWTATRLVYVSDASLLLEQAAGRLVRSGSDSGMVAVLDPRMLNAGPFKFGEPVRKTYQRALERFPHKTADTERALAWLRERRAKSGR